MAKNETVGILSGLVADGAVFYQKLRHYHWHVRGERFFDLHAKFEELYTRWAVIVDELAERVVSLGGTAPHTLAQILEKATVKEDESTPKSREMVSRLAADLEHLVAAFDRAAKEAGERGDDITVNLCEDFRDEQNKEQWMLRAWLREE